MLKRIILIFGMVLMTTSVLYAQPGGRPTRPAPGGNNPSNAPQINPQITPIAPQLQSTPIAPNMQITPPAQITLPAFQGTPFAMPTNWQDFVMPTSIPANAADLQALLQTLDLPYDIALEAPNFENSEVAYAAVVGFGQTYLGITVAPIYAAEFSTAQLTHLVGTSSSAAAQLAQITSQFPAEVQAMLENASGVAYGAFMSDGVAIVYTGDCTAAQCSVIMDSLQFTITEESLGGYGLYRPTTVANADQALNLIRSTYPGLSSLNLMPVTTTSGYAFSAITGEAASATLKGYYVGTVAVNNQTLVYALVGIGTGYVEIIRP